MLSAKKNEEEITHDDYNLFNDNRAGSLNQ